VLQKSLAIGYIKPEFAEVGTELSIEILGESKRATVVVESPYDPANADLRA
jgi:dimethylglycine dehydrogenase